MKKVLTLSLLALGVSPERLSTVTFGKSQPVFSEQENWARAVNRRVQVEVDKSASAATTEQGEWKEAH